MDLQTFAQAHGIALASGAGKTTLLDVLAGHQAPSAGTIHAKGSTSGQSGHDQSIVQHSVYVPQVIRLPLPTNRVSISNATAFLYNLSSQQQLCYYAGELQKLLSWSVHANKLVA